MPITTITAVHAREVLDSRGKPTLEVTVTCEGGSGVFSVPSGASTGTHEAIELRDGDRSRHDGQGVLRAVANVNVNLGGALVGMDARGQHQIDERMLSMDGTSNKATLGGNAIIGVSVATAKAAAAALGIPLVQHLRSLAPDIKPSREVPFLNMNLINGGKHAATRLAFQEYKVVPQTDDIAEALEIGTRILHALRSRIAREYGPVSANVGDEGGFAPDLASVRRPLELFLETATDLKLEHRIRLALDIAASSFYDAATDNYEFDGERRPTVELEQTIRGIIRDFPMLYIEDPFNEDKVADFARLNADAGTLIVGDDLTVTNPKYLREAIDAHAIGGVIIKVNQVGTLSETFATMKLARDNDIHCIMSHRSGETNDDFLADLAVAFGAFGVKAGGPQRGERIAKYNRFLQLLS
jgi:enolase